MNNIANQFLSIEQLQDKYLKPESQINGRQRTDSLSFQSILEEKQQETQLRFSKHAMGRLLTRDIELDNTQVQRLANGVEKADGKGIKDSLMILDSLAFIVNVPSRTVITAMDQTEAENNIFTNIDGAVIV